MARATPTGLTIPRSASAETQRFFEQISQRLMSLDGEIRRVGGGTGGGVAAAPATVPADTGGGVPTLATPPKPLAVEVSCGIGICIVSWANPFRSYSNHGLARVYRHTADRFDESVELGQAPWLLYVDETVADSQTYYYWVRFESTGQVLGPVSDVASGMSALDPEAVYAEVEDWLEGSPLLAALRSDFDSSIVILEEIRRLSGVASLLTASAAEAADEAAATALASALDAGERARKLLADIGVLAREDRLVLRTSAAVRDAFDTATAAGAMLAFGTHATDTTADVTVAVYTQARVTRTFTLGLGTGVDWSAGTIYLRYGSARLDLTQANRRVAAGDVGHRAGEWQVEEGAARSDLKTQIDRVATGIAGKADASAVTALAGRVTTAEGGVSTNASAITGLTNSVAGKADATAVTALTGRVTTAEGSVESNTEQITALEARLVGTSLGPEQNSFTGTDRAAAEAARDTYATANPTWLAGYNADDDINIRLTWASASLRVYQHRVNTAADGEPAVYAWQDNGEVEPTAAAISGLSATVTRQGGEIAANTEAIDALETALPGKAEATAVTALGTRVGTAEGGITANADAITALASTVDGKASATAVSTLGTRVDENEDGIEANSAAIVALRAAPTGFEPGATPNSFSAVTRAAAEAARDGQAANAAWLAGYAADPQMFITLRFD